MCRLVAKNVSEYRNLAKDLATDRDRLNQLRTRLKQSRITSGLFDARTVARAIEAAYQRMHEIRMSEQDPMPFAVGS